MTFRSSARTFRMTGYLLAVLFICSLIACSDTKQEAAQKTSALPFTGRTLAVAERQLAVGGGLIRVDLTLPPGYHFTDEAPSSLEWTAEPPGIITAIDGATSVKLRGLMFPIVLRVTSSVGTTMLQFEITAFFCEDISKVCQFERFRITAPVTVASDGQSEIVVSAEIEPPSLQ